MADQAKIRPSRLKGDEPLSILPINAFMRLGQVKVLSLLVKCGSAIGFEKPADYGPSAYALLSAQAC